MVWRQLLFGDLSPDDSIRYVSHVHYPGVIYQAVAVVLFFLIYLLYKRIINGVYKKELDKLKILAMNDNLSRKEEMDAKILAELERLALKRKGTAKEFLLRAQ